MYKKIRTSVIFLLSIFLLMNSLLIDKVNIFASNNSLSHDIKYNDDFTESTVDINILINENETLVKFYINDVDYIDKVIDNSLSLTIKENCELNVKATILTGVDEKTDEIKIVVDKIENKEEKTENTAKSKTPAFTSTNQQTIQIHSIHWLNGSNSTVIDGTNLSTTPENEPSSNVTCQINFSLGGEGYVEPGQIEIRVPYHIFKNRDGNITGTTSIPLSQAPSEEGPTGFNYYIDETTDEIVIKNFEIVSGSYFFSCDIGYNYNHRNVPNGYSNDDIVAKFKVDTGNGIIEDSSEPHSINLTTTIETPTAKQKKLTGKYEKWQSKWGKEPADSKDYFYLVYETSVRAYYGSQPSDLYAVEEPGDHLELIGWTWANSGHWELGNKERYDQQHRTFNAPYSDDTVIRSILFRVPRTALEETKIFTNRLYAKNVGFDGDVKTSDSITTTYTYVPPVQHQYPGDQFSSSKTVKRHAKDAGIFIENGHDSPPDTFVLRTTARAQSLLTDEDSFYNITLSDSNVYHYSNSSRIPLNKEDYSFATFGIWQTEYDYIIDEDTGYEEVYKSVADTPIEIQIKTNNDEDWVKYGEVTESSLGTFWTPVSGEGYKITTSSPNLYNPQFTYIPLPKDTWAIQAVKKGTSYKVDLALYIQMILHPTDNTKSIFETSSDGKIRLINEGHSKIDDSTGKTVYEREPYEYLDYESRAPRVSMRKQGGTIKQDSVNGQVRVPVSIFFESYRYVSYIDEAIKETVLSFGLHQEERSGTFYDLLPPGTYIDPSTIQVGTWHNPNTANSASMPKLMDRCDYVLETINNWRGSGRTMVIFHVSVPDDVRNLYLETDSDDAHLDSTFYIKYEFIDSWENIQINGNTLKNQVAYVSDGDLYSLGKPDDADGIAYADRDKFTDLDNDGNPEGTKKNVVYATSNHTINTLFAKEFGYKKSVKEHSALNYGSGAEVSGGAEYSYRLRFANDNHNRTGDIVFFDILENSHGDNPYWKGQLKSVNVSQALNKGIDAVIYYSTIEDFSDFENDESLRDLSNTEIWQSSAPEDLSSVKAIAIDLQKDKEGNPYFFEPEESIACELFMIAPADYRPYVDDPDTTENETVYAYNNSYLQISAVTSEGQLLDSAIESCPTVKVSLRTPDVKISKISDPVTGEKDNPKIVKVEDTITYTLTVVNESLMEAAYEMNVEDIIPDGLTIDSQNIKYYFGTNKDDASLVNGSDRVSLEIDEQKIVFTIDKLLGTEKINFIIPVKVTAVNTNNLYDNTAFVTEYNGLPIVIESDTTYHCLDTYTLTYNVLPDDTYGTPSDSITPEKVEKIFHDGKVDPLADIPTTEWTTSDGTEDGIPGTWSFSSHWTEDSSSPNKADLTNNKIENIKENKNLYGKWTFTPDTYSLTYNVLPDDKYGTPSDSTTPETIKNIAYDGSVDPLADTPTTNWTTSDGTDDGIPGTWSFSSHWTEDETQPNKADITNNKIENIKENKNIYGKWIFTPYYGHLNITKTVVGKRVDKDKEFNFIIRLSDNSINGVYNELIFENGVAEFTLKDGESKTIENIPVKTKYVVEEEDYSNEGYITSKTGDAGVIEREKTAIVAFTNTMIEPETGNLKLSKTVNGNKSDKEKYFIFTVTLNVDGSYEYTGSKSGTIRNGDTILLKHNEFIIIKNLPTGAIYTVAESDNSNYHVSSKNEKGVVVGDKTIDVTFINTKKTAVPNTSSK